jgi:hypothetical protein
MSKGKDKKPKADKSKKAGVSPYKAAQGTGKPASARSPTNPGGSQSDRTSDVALSHNAPRPAPRRHGRRGDLLSSNPAANRARTKPRRRGRA